MELTAEQCGVIATVIPVFLLAMIAETRLGSGKLPLERDWILRLPAGVLVLGAIVAEFLALHGATADGLPHPFAQIASAATFIAFGGLMGMLTVSLFGGPPNSRIAKFLAERLAERKEPGEGHSDQGEPDADEGEGVEDDAGDGQREA